MRVLQRVRRFLAGVFSIDLRTLALFRAGVGSVLCVSLLSRFGDLTAFYADGGAVPRALLTKPESLLWSLHFAGGSAWYQGALLALQALAALCLAIGCRTRLAAVLSWLLLVSLHNRNPMVLTPGDDPLLWLLFWGMFLPLGARGSVDAAWSAAPPAAPRALSWASAGLVLQFVAFGVFGALAFDDFARALGDAYRVLLPLAAVLALVPLGGWWWDALARRSDHGRHLKIYYDEGCAFCLKSCLLLRELLILPRAELLPAQGSARVQALMQAQYTWVVIDGEDVAHTRWGAFVALLRHSLLLGWGWRLAALKLWERPGNAVYDWVARHRGALGRITRARFALREVRFEPPAWTQAFPAVVLAAWLPWHYYAVGPLPEAVVSPLASGLSTLRMDVDWHRYFDYKDQGLSPTPVGWIIAPGQLADGTEVDAMRPWQRGVDFARPTHRARNARWHWYHARLAYFGTALVRSGHLPAYARHLCRTWNAGEVEARRLERFRITAMSESAGDGAAGRLEQQVLMDEQCN